MCGLNCILNFDGSFVNRKQIKVMNDKIIHRGPDNQSVFIDKHIGFGHCRLSIIDLSNKANQPMSSVNGRYIIIYNGEIYNFKEIKVKLIKQGYYFSSDSDTEVILNSYIKWGENCVKLFNGMFAFLIWDKKTNTLFGARDRFGIKPLYYSYSNKQLIISSEIKSILNFIEPTIDKKSLVEYFLFQNYLFNKTLIKDVKLFEKGTYFFIKNRNIDSTKYYSHKNKIFNNNKNSYSGDILKCIEIAVEKNLISDVPVGSYLSSGLDSALISSFASKRIDVLNTFTCGFELEKDIPRSFDESVDALEISKFLNTNHHCTTFNKNDFHKYIKIISRVIEEPRLGMSLQNYRIAEFASKYNKVVLSGAGGDELFGGYPWRYKSSFESKSVKNFTDNYLQNNLRFNPMYLDKLFRPIINEINTKDVLEDFHSFFGFLSEDSNEKDFINASLLFDLEYFLEGYCIIEDKISMSQSLETRVPFLENNLVDLAMQLEVGKKIVYNNGKIEGKNIIRDIGYSCLPEKFLKKKKQGFAAPFNFWLNIESLPILDILNKNKVIYTFIDYDFVKKKITNDLNNKKDRNFIWSVLSFNGFIENYLDNG